MASLLSQEQWIKGN